MTDYLQEYLMLPEFDPLKGLDDNERMMAGCFQIVSFAVGAVLGLVLCVLL